MKIGVISDTHGFLDPRIPDLFKGVDHIIHAGDVGPHSLLQELAAIAPVTAVLGNTDMGVDLRLTEVVELNKRKLMVHHIVDPLALSMDLMRTMQETRPDAVIFGHTHKRFYGQQGGVLFLNPGYSGRPKHGTERSVAVLYTDARELWVDFLSL